MKNVVTISLGSKRRYYEHEMLEVRLPRRGFVT